MGHIRLHRLPASRQWHQVVALLSGEADSAAIAGASATAAESSLRHAHDDSALAQSFWLLMRIPIAARSADFPGELRSLGLHVGEEPSRRDVTPFRISWVSQGWPGSRAQFLSGVVEFWRNFCLRRTI
jgi:hypothetical protein